MESEKLKIRLAPKYFASEFFIAQLHPHKRYWDKQAESHWPRKQITKILGLPGQHIIIESLLPVDVPRLL